MTRNKFGLARWLLLSTSLVFSIPVFSLGLGEHQLESWLGQPLNMRLGIVDIDSEYGLDQVRVTQLYGSSASELGYELESTAPLVNLKVVEEAGHKWVLLASKESVDEPFISILLRLEWPQGTLLKSYTLFLDLPPEPALASRPERSLSEKPSQRSEQELKKARQPVSASPDDLADTKEYRVQSGDTLYGIAHRIGSSPSRTIPELVDSIHQANPQAFINNDRNRLIAGALLKVSDLPSSSAQGGQDFASQPSTGKQAGKQAERSAAANPGQPEGELRLTKNSLPVANISEMYNDTGEVEKDKQAMESHIAAVAETVDLLERENTELKERLRKLETSDRVRLLEELLLMQQNQISDLKTELASSRGPSVPAVASRSAGPDSSDAGSPVASVSQVSIPAWMIAAFVVMALMIFILLVLILKRRPQQQVVNTTVLKTASADQSRPAPIVEAKLPVDEFPESGEFNAVVETGPSADRIVGAADTTPLLSEEQSGPGVTPEEEAFHLHSVEEAEQERQDLDLTIAEDALKHLADDDYWGEKTGETDAAAVDEADVNIDHLKRPENLLDLDADFASEIDLDDLEDLSGLGEGLFGADFTAEEETIEPMRSIEEDLAEIENLLLGSEVEKASQKIGTLMEQHPGNKKIEEFIKAWETIFRFDG